MGNKAAKVREKLPEKLKKKKTRVRHIEISPRELKMFCGVTGGTWSGHVTYCDFLITNRAGKRISYQLTMDEKMEALVIGTNNMSGCLAPDQSKMLRLEFGNKPENIREWMKAGEKSWVGMLSVEDEYIKQEDVSKWWDGNIDNKGAPGRGWTEASIQFVFRDPPTKLEENPAVNCPRTERRRKVEEKKGKGGSTLKGPRSRSSSSSVSSSLMATHTAYGMTPLQQPYQPYMMQSADDGERTAMPMYPMPRQPPSQMTAVPMYPPTSQYVMLPRTSGPWIEPEPRVPQPPSFMQPSPLVDKTQYGEVTAPSSDQAQQPLADPSSTECSTRTAAIASLAEIKEKKDEESAKTAQPPSSGSDSTKAEAGMNNGKIAEKPGDSEAGEA